MRQLLTELAVTLRLDLRQHGLVLLLLWLGTASLCGLLFAAALQANDGLSSVAILPVTQQLSLLVFIHAAAGRLVRTDLMGGEIELLQSLPLRRTVLWTTRYLMLLTWQLTLSLGLLALAIAATNASIWHADAVTRMIVVAVCGAWLVTSLGWLLALLGRYQLPAAGGLFFLAASLAIYLGLSLLELPGVWLLSDHALGALEALPTSVLRDSLSLTTLLMLASVLLILHRDGLTIRRLAAPMDGPQRTRTLGFGAAVVLISQTLQEYADDGTYTLAGAHEHELAGVRVRVSRLLTEGDVPLDAEALAPLTRVLQGWPVHQDWPTVYLVEAFDLEGLRWRVKDQGDEDSLVIEVDRSAPGFAPEHLAPWLAMSLIDVHTRYRAALPHAWWLSRGLATTQGVTLQEEVPSVALLTPTEQMLGCARKVRDLSGLDVPTLFHRDLLRERVGERAAPVVAGSLVYVLEQASGPGTVVEILGEVWRHRPARGIAGWLPERLDPPAARVARRTALDPDELAARWNEVLDALPPRVLEVVDPIGLPDLRVEPTEGSSEGIRLAAWLDPGPDPLYPVQVRYAKLPVFDQPIDLDDTRTLSSVVPGEVRRVETDESWPAGTRLAWRIERWAEPLGCWLATPWHRSTL
jgi:hypothetical protein